MPNCNRSSYRCSVCFFFGDIVPPEIFQSNFSNVNGAELFAKLSKFGIPCILLVESALRLIAAVVWYALRLEAEAFLVNVTIYCLSKLFRDYQNFFANRQTSGKVSGFAKLFPESQNFL